MNTIDTNILPRIRPRSHRTPDPEQQKPAVDWPVVPKTTQQPTTQLSTLPTFSLNSSFANTRRKYNQLDWNNHQNPKKRRKIMPGTTNSNNRNTRSSDKEENDNEICCIT